MWGLQQKQNARRADKIRLYGHLRRYKKIVKKTYIIYLEHFYKTAQSSSICDFYNNLENSIYHVELRKALSLIHEHKYQGALDYLKDKGEGIFKNGDVSINNAIREYCINQLS